MAKQRKVIHSDPDILGGRPVFVGTRVPVQNLIDCLEAGDSLEEFLDSFPTIQLEMQSYHPSILNHLIFYNFSQ